MMFVKTEEDLIRKTKEAEREKEVLKKLDDRSTSLQY